MGQCGPLTLHVPTFIHSVVTVQTGGVESRVGSLLLLFYWHSTNSTLQGISDQVLVGGIVWSPYLQFLHFSVEIHNSPIYDQ